MMICFWEKTFWAKTSLSFVFRGPNSVHSDSFQACQSQWYKFQSCMMICFRETTFWAKRSLSFVFRGPNSVHLRFSDVPITMVQFQSCMMICFWETTFWAKTSLSFVFRGPNSVHPEHFVFRCANHNGTDFKAVWWFVSEKPHFGLKHHFPLYLEGQTQCTWGFQACQS